MTRDKTVSVATNEDGKCILVSKVKHLSDDEVVELKKEANEYGIEKVIETLKNSFNQFVSNVDESFTFLNQKIDTLEHEIKVLKGEE